MKTYTLGSVVRAGALGTLLGGAAGVVLGLLLAPEEGQIIRRRLAYQLEHIAYQMGALVDHMLSPDADSEARRTGDAVVADAQERAQRIRNDIDALLGEMKRQGAPRQPSSSE